MTALHEDEIPIDLALVRRLVDRLADRLPEYAGMVLRPMGASGSSNALFRLDHRSRGDRLLVRLPRQPGGTASIEKEARWLPVLAEHLSVAVPEVLAVGEPGFGYPEKWSVTTWLDGEPPGLLGGSARLAGDLARFVTELRELPVPADALHDPDLRWYRGGPLAALDDRFGQAVDQCRAIPDLGLDLDRALTVWAEALDAERTAPVRRTWLHGDLLAENLLADRGGLAGVLDFGGLAVGDPTVDLIVAWEVLDAPGRRVFTEALGVGPAEWAKGKGWALLIAMLTFPYYGTTMPQRCAARRAMAAAVLSP